MQHLSFDAQHVSTMKQNVDGSAFPFLPSPQQYYQTSIDIEVVYLDVYTISKTENSISNISLSIMAIHINHNHIFIIITVKHGNVKLIG